MPLSLLLPLDSHRGGQYSSSVFHYNIRTPARTITTQQREERSAFGRVPYRHSGNTARTTSQTPTLPACHHLLFILHTRLTHPIPYTTHANRHRQARIRQEENQTSDENRAGIASRHPRIPATLAHPSPLSFESQPPPPNPAGSVPAL